MDVVYNENERFAAEWLRNLIDAGHLWPAWFALIRECRPPIIFGEQVAGTSGRAWLDAVFLDLETQGYRCAGADLCAAGIGAPHKRQRLFWVAHLHGGRLVGVGAEDREEHEDARRNVVDRRGQASSMGDTDGDPVGQHVGQLHADAAQRDDGSEDRDHRPERASANGAMWADPDWVFCDDPGGARWRPVEPGTFPLAARSSNGVGRLRAYGNAIVAPLAVAFVQASLQALRDSR